MSDYEKQFQTTANHSESGMRKIEQNGGESRSVVSRSDLRVHDWADVLRDLEAYY